MTPLAELIKAIAALLWPAIAIFFLWHFRGEIARILRRLSQIRRGKLLGQEIELGEQLDELKASSEAAQAETARAIPPTKDAAQQIDPSEQFEEQLLRDAATSPKVKLMLLETEIEKRLRRLLAATGWSHISVAPIADAIDQLRAQGTLPSNVSGSLKLFLEVRNKILHGYGVNDEDTLRAIDSGFGVLKAIDAVPAEVNIVFDPGVDLYSDPECRNRLPDVKGVILEVTSPNGVSKKFRIFPTTRTHFVKGRRVAWEWSFDRTWGETWYKDPTTGEVKPAWKSAAEFIGRDLAEV